MALPLAFSFTALVRLRALRAAGGVRFAHVSRLARFVAPDGRRLAFGGACALAVCGAWPMPAAQAQTTVSGAIVIPGNGETHPADAQALVARMAAMSPPAAPAQGGSLAALRATATPRAGRPADGDIVIPGNGEAAGRSAAAGWVQSGAIRTAGEDAGQPVPQGAGMRAAMQTMRPTQAMQTMQAAESTQAAQAQRPPAARVVNLNAAMARAAVRPVMTSVPVRVAGEAMHPAAAPVIDSIDPLAERGEPPQLGNGASTAAIRRVSLNTSASLPFGAKAAAGAYAAAPAAPSVTAAAAVNATTATTATGTVAAAGHSATVAAATTAPNDTSTHLPPAPAGQQSGESIRQTALAFLQQQAAGLPGKISITVAPAFARGLAACDALTPFMPPGSRMWGRTTVGVRCTGVKPWTIYLQARISLEASYYVSAHAIAPGEVINAADLVTRDGDLANLPRTVVTDPSQVLGAVALARIGAGLPLRQDMLRSPSAVTAGQTVRVVAQGEGFSISSQGSAMNSATPGQQVRVRTPNGQVITGIVKDGATVELQM